MRIAILEDDAAQLELLQCWIKEAGHSSEGFGTGQAFQNAVRRETYDLLIMDWNLPDTTGPEILAWVRQNHDWKIPVLFTTSRDAEEDIVRALESGADDYIVKPLKRAETLARLGALLRRALPDDGSDDTYSCTPFEFDVRNQRVTVNDEAVNLTNREFQLALFLFRNSGRLLSRRYILEHVWGISPDLTTRTVDTHVTRLRKKLGEAGSMIETRRGVGYRFHDRSTDR